MFPTPIDLWLTFITALLASGHCIGMCGGMVTALGFHRTAAGVASPPRATDFMVRHFFYGISRLSTYLLLGALSGWLGSMAPAVERSPLLTALPLWVAGIVMIVMGMETWGIRGLQFGMAKGWMARLENKTTAANHWQKPLVLGILTGLLPCGMHWAFQAKAFATGSVWGGLLILLAFGLGTLPAMLGLGWIIVLVGPKVRKVLQQVAAIFVVGMGGMILVKGFQKAGLMELSGHVH